MYYPYEEEAAGELRCRHQTNKASERLLASEEIVSLAKILLPNDTYVEAEQLSTMLTGTNKQKGVARSRLKELVAPPPKRPMFYCQHEMQYLPHWTRNTLRFLGDFVDMLVKAAVYEKTGNRKVFKTSFGPAVDAFSQYYPEQKQLAEMLRGYNRLLYRDAKHDFRLPPDRREHRFTSREVVLCIFITMELADRVTSVSKAAERVRCGQPM